MIDDLLRESSIAQLFMEQDREEGERQMARLALEGRFGALGEDVLAALGSAGEAALRDLVAHVSTDTLEQARGRLGLS
jgi:phage-related tail protein